MNSLTLYKYTGDPRRLIKDASHGLTQIEVLSGSFRHDVNLLTPVIEIEATSTTTVNKLLTECNYVYISDLQRYYFVDSVRCLNGTLVELTLNIDVYMTWSLAIQNISQGIVERNEEEANSNVYLDDSEIHVYNNPNIQTYAFEYAAGNTYTFGNQHFILAVAGS